MSGRSACRCLALLVAALALIVLIVPVSAQEPPLPDLLAKAAQASVGFADPTRMVVGEESHEQTLVRIFLNAAGKAEYKPIDEHKWVTELAVVATPDEEPRGFPWLELRDLVSREGQPVRAGGSRLGPLATERLDVIGPTIAAYSAESAAVRLGRLNRAELVPRLAFVLLHAANQPRFEFKRGGNRTIDGVKTREVRFKETARPTIIRASDLADSPSEGSFWIDPATGDVLMSRIKSADSSSLSVEQTVTYRRDAATGLRLPSSMEEKVVDDDEAIRVEGKSKFSNWRIVPRKG